VRTVRREEDNSIARPPRSRGPGLGEGGVGSAGAALILGALLPFLAGCDDSQTGPESFRFGQVGEVRIDLTAPAVQEGGVLRQTLVWSSEGPWRLTESISYLGRLGDETVVRSEIDPRILASAYASLVALINESEGVKLFVDELPPDLDPSCASPRSRLSFTVRDQRRGDERAWTRCAQGSIGTLTTRGAGPDGAAGRVVQAAILARDFALRQEFRSVYMASLPFGTLDRGEASGAQLSGPLAFVGTGGREPPGWRQFWRDHTGTDDAPPEVDWDEEMVVVGAVGVRQEAGDSVEVRRILPVGDGTLVEMVERVPGDFCAPAARRQVPFHIVVSPRGPAPVRFGDVQVERVSCGL